MLRQSDSRIEPAINNIRQRVGDDVGDADHQHAALHEEVVAFVDAVVDEEQAEAGPVENLFGDDGPGEQHAELQAEDGDDRDQAVLQDVLVHHLAFAQAFGARRANVILVQFFDDGRAHHAREQGGERCAECDGGQDDVAPLETARRREQAELDGEEVDQERPDHEARQADTDERDD